MFIPICRIVIAVIALWATLLLACIWWREEKESRKKNSFVDFNSRNKKGGLRK